MESIPLIQPLIGLEEEQEVVDTLRSGLIGTGAKTAQFEREFAAYLGRKYAVGTNSCTAALHLSLAAFGVGPGDEVITTPLTFVATANSIIYAGATPVFVDVDPTTFNIDPQRIEEAITERTRAIIVVHLFGHPAEMVAIRQIGERHGLKIVVDSAHAIEAEYNGVKSGSLGDTDCFSFYATKNLAMGNGGILVTDDDSIIRYLQAARDHGMSPGAWARYTTGEFAHFEMEELGFKYIMWDVPASIGIQQLRRVEQRYPMRARLAQLYFDLLEGMSDDVQIVRPRPHVRHSHHLFPVLVDAAQRDAIGGYMVAQGIGVGVHYRPVHLEPYYRKTYGHREGEFPVAEEAGKRLLSLPFWPEMPDATAHRVVDTLKAAIIAHHGA